MFIKTKIYLLSHMKIASNLSMFLMSLATILGMLELSQEPYQKVILTDQSTLVIKAVNNPNNPIRRENEETDSNYVSYRESQRTYPRSGRY